MCDVQAEKAGVIFGWILWINRVADDVCLFKPLQSLSPQNGNALCYIFLEAEFTYSCDVNRHHTVSKLAEGQRKISQSCCKAVRSDETKVREYSGTLFLSIFFIKRTPK